MYDRWNDPFWILSYTAAITGFIARNQSSSHDCIKFSIELADASMRARDNDRTSWVQHIMES